VEHVSLSWTFGRFNDVTGKFSFDADKPEASSFSVVIKTESIDTGNQKRDDHLRSPDFFDAKQFPVISFTSKSVKATDKGYEVTGDFTLHGVTKSITIPMTGGKSAEFPQGTQRTGFTGVLGINRSDYGMNKLVGPVGDQVHIAVSFEGTMNK
jgi:polyisoprenoid-binding protein YceI